MSDSTIRKSLVTLAKIQRIPGYPYNNLDNETLEYKINYGSEAAKADKYILKHRHIKSEPFRKPKKHISTRRVKSHNPSTRRKSSTRSTKSSTRRTKSPIRRRKSPIHRRKSPIRRRKSPIRRRKSPIRRSKSPIRRRKSPIRRSKSPIRRGKSPIRQNKYNSLVYKTPSILYNLPVNIMPVEYNIKELQDNHNTRLRQAYSLDELDDLEQEGIMPGFLVPTMLRRESPERQNQRILSRVSRL